MRILIDECLPRKLKRHLSPHSSLTVAEAGFAGKKNGILMGLAEAAGFDILLTMDKGIEYGQNMTDRRIAVVILQAKANRMPYLLPLIPSCVERIASIEPGQVARIR
jgi:predicted nuclease of predicted toxin-antitoxin system